MAQASGFTCKCSIGGLPLNMRCNEKLHRDFSMAGSHLSRPQGYGIIGHVLSEDWTVI